MLYFVKFENRHPEVMASFCYIVEANDRQDLADKVKNMDGKMDLSEAILIKEVERISPYAFYVPEINGLPLK
jgi:hypothetical protein